MNTPERDAEILRELEAADGFLFFHNCPQLSTYYDAWERGIIEAHYEADGYFHPAYTWSRDAQGGIVFERKQG